MPIPQPEDTPGDTGWFVRDRFGLFVHWGIYSAAARHEWVKQSEKLIDMVRNINPGVLINNRSGVPQDLHTPEQFAPRGWLRVGSKPVVWETYQTLDES